MDDSELEQEMLGTDTFIGDEAADAAQTEPQIEAVQPQEEIKAPQTEEESFESLLKRFSEESDSADDTYTEDWEDPVDYKEKLISLKEEYKRTKREQKKALKEERMQASYGEEEVPSKPHVGLTVFISCVVTLLVCAVIFTLLLVVPNAKNSYFATLCKKYCLTAQDRYPNQDSHELEGETIEAGDNITIEVNGESSVAAVYAKAANSVVGVEVRSVSGQKWEQTTETVVGQGSGIIYSADGYILTNYHVISDAVDTTTRSVSSSYKIVVYFDTSLSKGYTVTSIVGYDESNDIAIIKVDVEGLTPIEFGDSDALSIGESIVAIGSPGGLEFMNSVSEGIISGLQRNITSSSTGNTIFDLIQITAAINPGNSGGALLNSKGELVGICVIKIVDSSYEGMGFAISSNTAKMIAESIMEHGKYIKAVIGVTINTAYDAEAADKKGWPEGAYVAEVSKGEGADKAGILADDIICELNGTRITTFDDLRRLLTHYSPDDSVEIMVYRTSTDEYVTVTVVLGAS